VKLHADLYPRGLPVERHKKVGHAGRGSVLGDAHWGLGWAAADGRSFSRRRGSWAARRKAAKRAQCRRFGVQH
jgi:hypothetical protein